ncbi:MAG: hypothetical protein WCR46_20110 [Deltaproteobacteria bacterium]|jgi:hypothetical protein
MLKEFLLNNSSKIREINRKYAKPNVEMSRWVKASLLLLRLYLIFLVGLLLYKFVTMI